MLGDGRQIATDARDKAEMATREVAVVGALTKAHIDDCARRSDKLEATLARRDAEMRDDLAQWRTILGQRLDRQDRIMLWITTFVVTGLIGIIGSLLHALGLLK